MNQIESIEASVKYFTELGFTKSMFSLDNMKVLLVRIRELEKRTEEAEGWQAQVESLNQELETLVRGYGERIKELEAEAVLLRGALAVQDERERQAGEKCGVPWEQHGCDWPEWAADEILGLRQELMLYSESDHK